MPTIIPDTPQNKKKSVWNHKVSQKNLPIDPINICRLVIAGKYILVLGKTTSQRNLIHLWVRYEEIISSEIL
jgi:hypothetical protein